jgi:hypothetical protein
MATVATMRQSTRDLRTTWQERALRLAYAYGIADAKAGDPPQLENTIPTAVREAYSRGYSEARG